MKRPLIFCFLLVLLSFPTVALESSPVSVVFLVDTSGSMTSNDPNRLVPDGMAQMIASLPSHYQVSIVAYGEEISFQMDTVPELVNISFFLENELLYQGYSNAGLGFATTVDLLSQREGEKHIIMICDGEILLGTSSATAQSQNLFQEAVIDAIGQEISLHMIALGDWVNADSFLLQQSQYLNGSFHKEENNSQDIWTNLLTEQFQLKYKPISSLDELPIYTYDRLMLLMQFHEVNEDELTFFSDSFVGSSERIIQGKNFALVSLSKPLESFEEVPEGISLYYREELSAQPQVDLYYVDTFVKGDVYLNREAVARISFFQAIHQNKQLFQEDFFENATVFYEVDEKRYSTVLKNGVCEIPLLHLNQQEVKFDFSEFPIEITCPSVVISPESAPFVPEIIEDKFLWQPYFFVLSFAGLFLILAYMHNKRKGTKEKFRSGRSGKNKCVSSRPKRFYSGKLLLELEKGRQTFPERTFALTHVIGHRPVSLDEILATCYELPTIYGTEQIIFIPSKEKMLVLENHSSATILYQHSILRKNQKHKLSYGDVLDIRLEDGSELVIIYDSP